MALKIQTERPFGIKPGSPVKALNLEGESEVLVDKSIELHSAFSRRWKKKFEAMTGLTIGARKGTYKGSPFTKDELAMRVKAGGGDSPDGSGWQGDGKNPDAQNELGGQYFPKDREAMGVFAQRIGIDLDQMEKALDKRGARLLYANADEPELNKDGVMVGRRTAMNTTTNANALAIDYLQDAQFVISHGDKLSACIGERVEIPNGRDTLEIKRLGYGQAYLQGELTTEVYTQVPAVSPDTNTTTLDPFKLMMSMWASGEYEENSFYPWLAAMEKAAQIGRNIARQHIILRGHTATGEGLNINAYGGALTLGALDPRLGANGFYASNWAGTINGGAANAFKGVDMQGQLANLNMVPTMRAKLNKYGIDPKPLRLIVGANTRAQFVQDGKARPDTYSMLVRQEGGTYYIDDVEVVVLPDSVVTNANTAGLPTYALWNSEGNPMNLQPDGTYTGGAGSIYTAAVMVNILNWIEATKRMWNWLVVRLPLADQVAVVGSERFDIKPIHPSLSEIVAYGLGLAA